MFYTYLLQCTDGSLYAGITTQPQRRFRQHTGQLSGGARYTKLRPPVGFAALWQAPDRKAASQLEYRLKHLSHGEKEALVRGEDPLGVVPAACQRIQTTFDGRILSVTVICYPKCTTCKKALAYLESLGYEYDQRHIKDQPPTAEELRDWQQRSGLPLKRFFNTSGQLYRAMELTKKLPDLSEEEQLALLASDGMLVKRPILLYKDQVLVGFRQAEWEALLRKDE